MEIGSVVETSLDSMETYVTGCQAKNLVLWNEDCSTKYRRNKELLY